MAFNAKQRKIFRYYNGIRRVGIDPLDADIALEAVDLDWEAQFSLLEIGDSAAAVAVVAAARKVFKVPEFTIDEDEVESGLSSVEILDLLGEFMQWRIELRNFTEPTPISPPSTESAGPQPATDNGTDCTSTSPAKSPATASP
jgi:hypothetical protein